MEPKYSNQSTISTRFTRFVNRNGHMTADKIHEYCWPPDGTGEVYMIQEQVSDWLRVLSFKRKYPGLYILAIRNLILSYLP